MSTAIHATHRQRRPGRSPGGRGRRPVRAADPCLATGQRSGAGWIRGLAAVGGFSYADVPESAKGWAATILFNDKMKEMFQQFYDRPDTFTLGICNGCQLFGLLGWVPWQGIDPQDQPRFVRNISGRFESRWSTVKVLDSKAIMLRGMEDLVFGIHVAHGEGRVQFPDATTFEKIKNDDPYVGRGNSCQKLYRLAAQPSLE